MRYDLTSLTTAVALVALLGPLAGGPSAHAQEPDTVTAAEPAASDSAGEDATGRESPEERAERERREAGLRVGVFQARGLTSVEGAAYATTPAFEGYFQKGLDQHLAIESSVGFWRRSQWQEGSGGGVFGSEGGERVDSYVVPILTSVKFYPFTVPGAGVEPYVTGGLGFALGIDDRENTSGGFLGVGGSDGTAILTGLGFKAGAGVELRLGEAFGVGLGGRYQWTRYGHEVGGARTYQGWTFDGGLLYRFQY